MICPVDHKVEGRTQGKFKLFSSQTQVRKGKSEKLALLLGFRMVEQLSGPRSHGNQGFQCRAVIALAVVVLLNPKSDLGLPLLKFARFFVVLIPRNTPSSARSRPTS